MPPAAPTPPDPTADTHALVGLLRSRGESLAVAESLTGGRVAAGVTAVPGASAVFLGGVVSYATAVKVSVLGVPTAVVDSDGVVSARCAEEMAEGVRTLMGATWGLSTTGVAGPEPQEGKPVGTVFVGLAGPHGRSAVELRLSGDRASIQAETCRAAWHRLADTLSEDVSDDVADDVADDVGDDVAGPPSDVGPGPA